MFLSQRPVKQKVKEEDSSLLDDDDVKKGRPRRSNRRANLPTRLVLLERHMIKKLR